VTSLNDEPSAVEAGATGSAVPLEAGLEKKEAVVRAEPPAEKLRERQDVGRDAEAFAAGEQAQLTRDKRQRGVALADAPAAGFSADAAAAPPDLRFRALAARAPRSAGEWRSLRDEWQVFAGALGTGSVLGDEACVRAIAAGLELVRVSAEPGDEALFREAARAYLARPEARQKPRVRALVEAAASRR